MAIDRTGISSLESGAPEIKYTGDEGPQDPRAMTDIEKIILQHWLQQGGSYGDIIPEEFKQQIIQLYGLDKMASVPEMAEGGIARLGYRGGKIIKGQDHMLAYITPGEANTLKNLGGQETMTPEGIPAYPPPGEYGGPGYAGSRSPDTGRERGIQAAAQSYSAPTPAAPAYSQSYNPGAGGVVTHSPITYTAAQKGTLSDPAEKMDYFTQQDIGTGDYRDVDPLTGERIITPPLSDNEGLGPTGPTPAELEAMRIRLLLAQQEADKAAADEKVAAIKEQEEEDAFLASLKREYDFEDLEYGDDRGLMYAAHGGRVPAAYGGLMGNDGRRAYGLGSFFKSVTKPFKKAAKTIKKVAKSPIGKLALGYLATAGLGNLAAGGGNWSRFIGSATKPGWLRPSQVWSNVAGMLPGSNTSSISNKETLQKAYDFHIKNKNWDTAEKIKKLIDSQGATGGLQTAMKTAAFGLPLLALKYPNLGEVPGLSMEDATAANQAAADAWSKTHLQGLDEEDWKLTSASELTPLQYSAQGGRIGYTKGGPTGHSPSHWNSIIEAWNDYDGPMTFSEFYNNHINKAQGGRIGYADGGNDDEELPHRTAALSAMYGLRKKAQEGGLMDLGGMEKDYRNEGGFVPIGGQERADDVPARLSKNEFVFTADAVRNAGGGDIDKGAEIMENLMENLEQGGKVSEESQGLEGARNMFATAQKLEGVL